MSKSWLTKYGDRHASWCECVFAVKPGDIIIWIAGCNAGNRGSERRRIHLEFRVDPEAEVTETPNLGYGSYDPTLRGRLALVRDILADQARQHREALEEL